MAFTQWWLQLNIDSAAIFAAAYVFNISVYIVYSYFFLEETDEKTLCLDLGGRLGEHRIIGDSRGFSGTLVALIIGYTAWMLLGSLYHLVIAVGANFGTILNSFIKRRLGIERGEGLPFLDQTDFILGAFLFATPITTISLPILITGLAQAFIIHTLVNICGRPSWKSLIKK